MRLKDPLNFTYTFSLDREDVKELLEIFELFLESFAMSDDSDIDNSVKFIIKFIGSVFPGCYDYDFSYKFIETAKNRREKHIDWLFGSDSDGRPQFVLPKTFEEMRKLLEVYDIRWLGHDESELI